ncbi:MAG: hypothetical protein GY711_14050 [bacterium]|nr:hypothetical protein [bacterium]
MKLQAPLLALALLCACPASETDAGDGGETAGTQGQTSAADTPASDGLETPPADPPAEVFDFAPGGPITDAELTEFHVEMTCAIGGESVGTMTFALWKEMPITARNFLRYCAEDFYAGTSFHRIMREAMVQGGDPAGDGTGKGSYGTIASEATLNREFGHRYGVLAMARGEEPDSASCQFYVCCADTPGIWELDGEYTAFGTLVHGVAALEAIASVQVVRDPEGGERSVPLEVVTVTGTRVVRGAPARTETAERPLPDLGGEPAFVRVQFFVVSEAGRDPVPRTYAEAQALADFAIERAGKGEDFSALVREYSDVEPPADDPLPGTERVANTGVPTSKSLRRHYEGMKEIADYRREIYDDVQMGLLSSDQFRNMINERRTEVLVRLRPHIVKQRADFPKGVANAMFTMKVGEIVRVDQHPSLAPGGWYVIKRLE